MAPVRLRSLEVALVVCGKGLLGIRLSSMGWVMLVLLTLEVALVVCGEGLLGIRL